MSVLTEGFLKPEAHFLPSKAEVIHLANSVVVVQFNFRLLKKKKGKRKRFSRLKGLWKRETLRKCLMFLGSKSRDV